MIGGARWGFELTEELDDAPGHFRRHRCAPLGDLSDALEQPLGQTVYFAWTFEAATCFRTSLGDVFFRLGRACFLAMCVESTFIPICSPQNRHRALPGGM